MHCRCCNCTDPHTGEGTLIPAGSRAGVELKSVVAHRACWEAAFKVRASWLLHYWREVVVYRFNCCHCGPMNCNHQ